jgi:RecA-family ATPase
MKKLPAKKLTFSIGSQGFDKESSWTIQSLIPAQSLGILVGATGAYKTFLTIAMACSSATGSKFGEESTEGGFSVLVSGEGSSNLGRRIKAWEVKNNRVVGDKLLRVDQALNPLDADEYRLLVDAIKCHQSAIDSRPSLIIFDTLSQCASGLDENSAGIMSLFLRACYSLTVETGATVLLIHHNGKNSGYRGSGALECNVDFMLTLEKTKSDMSTKLAIKKMKDGDTNLTYQFELDLIDLNQRDQFGSPITSLAVGAFKKSTSSQATPLKAVDNDIVIILKTISEMSNSGMTVASYKNVRRQFIVTLVSNGINEGTASNRFTRAVKAALLEKRLKQNEDGLALAFTEPFNTPLQLKLPF